MQVPANTNPCARAEDLVTYLYNEATRAEAKDFEHHMQHCASCRTEFATFGDVREAMGEWRRQALGSLTSPSFEAHASQVFAPAVAPALRRSALGALREFFALSPAWMRAATAVAALMFCALAAIAVFYFAQQPQTVVVEKPVKSGYSDEEVKRIVAEAMKKQQESQKQEAPSPSAEIARARDSEQPKARPQIERNASGAPQMANNNRRRQSVPRAVAQPSTELVSTNYLPFTASEDDEKLPSLADLVDDANQE